MKIQTLLTIQLFILNAKVISIHLNQLIPILISITLKRWDFCWHSTVFENQSSLIFQHCERMRASYVDFQEYTSYDINVQFCPFLGRKFKYLKHYLHKPERYKFLARNENQNKTCLGDFHTQCASGIPFLNLHFWGGGGIRFMNFLNNKIEIHHIISVVGTYMNICHIVCLTALLLRPPFFAPLGTLLRYSEE